VYAPISDSALDNLEYLEGVGDALALVTLDSAIGIAAVRGVIGGIGFGAGEGLRSSSGYRCSIGREYSGCEYSDCEYLG